MHVSDATAYANVAAPPLSVVPPVRVGGSKVNGDLRDFDYLPTVAYGSSVKLFLVVWLSPRNAQGNTNGFDIYGKFLNSVGVPMGNEFRISDSNSVARNAAPAVASDGREFVVVWSSISTTCVLYAQRITQSVQIANQLILSESSPVHSPALIYNPQRGKYVAAYVSGEDYMPPTLLGGNTASCGNNSQSTSHIEAIELTTNPNNSNGLLSSSPVSISNTGGGFRPRITYNLDWQKYLVVWEDRSARKNTSTGYDVSGHLINSDLSSASTILTIDAGYDYANYDSTTSWTPRPTVTVGNQFFVTWFRHTASTSSQQWTVVSRKVDLDGTMGAFAVVASIYLSMSHSGNSPSGFLDSAYVGSQDGYLVSFSMYSESLFGYLSSALIQRVDESGALLANDGSGQLSPSFGHPIDNEIDDQIGMSLVVKPASLTSPSQVVVTYAKHHKSDAAPDFDIWTASINYSTLAIAKHVYLPVTTR